MPRCASLLIPLFLLSPLVAGCASRSAEPQAMTEGSTTENVSTEPGTLAETDEGENDVAEEIELVRPGPPVTSPVDALATTHVQQDEDSTRDRLPQTPREQGPGARGNDPAPGSSPDDTAILVQASRTDGRPEWWIDGPVRADGRLRIAAEALGRDVLEARRAAVSAGRSALERLVGDGMHDERVVYATVRPLPRGASPSGPRFVGYVLMSSAAPVGE